MTVLLSGIVGSHAHGLDSEWSDFDVHAVHVEPTLDLVGLEPAPDPTWVGKIELDDVSSSEAGHFARLLAKCNPYAMELLWLPRDLYLDVTPFGETLLDLRTDVLNGQTIKRVYAGFIASQVRKLRNARADHGAPTRHSGATGLGDPKRRAYAAKLVRHGLRAAAQAEHILMHGEVVVRMENPKRFRAYDDDPWVSGADALDHAADVLGEVPSLAVPEELPEGALDSLAAWLRSVRLAHLV